MDRSLANALGIKGSGAYWQKKKEQKGALLPEYISTNYLTPFISDEMRIKLSEPIIYCDTDGKITEGIAATTLVDICDIWQQADKKGALENRTNAKLAAEKAYIIFKGFANVGITALVDEATDYHFQSSKKYISHFFPYFSSIRLTV